MAEWKTRWTQNPLLLRQGGGSSPPFGIFMMLISEEDKEYLRESFEQKIVDDVKLLLFTQKIGCDSCETTEQLLKEVVELSPKINLEIYNFVIDQEQVRKYEIDKVPAIVILGKKDYGIRFFGIPSGYEFSSLVEAIYDVSCGKTDLSQYVKAQISTINNPVHIQVFVTPSCPYCRQIVRTAYKLAIESDNIKASIIEVMEFPNLSNKYMVYTVPKVVINDVVEFDGVVDENNFLSSIKEACKEQ